MSIFILFLLAIHQIESSGQLSVNYLWAADLLSFPRSKCQVAFPARGHSRLTTMASRFNSYPDKIISLIQFLISLIHLVVSPILFLISAIHLVHDISNSLNCRYP